jgi:hypothetical protein
MVDVKCGPATVEIPARTCRSCEPQGRTGQHAPRPSPLRQTGAVICSFDQRFGQERSVPQMPKKAPPHEEKRLLGRPPTLDHGVVRGWAAPIRRAWAAGSRDQEEEGSMRARARRRLRLRGARPSPAAAAECCTIRAREPTRDARPKGRWATARRASVLHVAPWRRRADGPSTIAHPQPADLGDRRSASKAAGSARHCVGSPQASPAASIALHHAPARQPAHPSPAALWLNCRRLGCDHFPKDPRGADLHRIPASREAVRDPSKK